jgi:two-component system response regulator RegA
MKLLVVEDDIALREAVCGSAADWVVAARIGSATVEARFSVIAQAGSVAEAIALQPDAFELMIVDVKLGNESGLALVEHVRQAGVMPAILAVSGQATAVEAFQLASLGVRGYLGKPFDMHELRRAMTAVFESAPDLSVSAMAQVGHRHIHVVQDEVKLAMLKRALQWDNGNITRAAKRLGITRAAVQQMMDRFSLPRSDDSKRDNE